MALIFLSLMFLSPVLALLANLSLVNKVDAARSAGYFIGVGFIIALTFLGYLCLTQNINTYPFIEVNSFTVLLCNLILLISFVVHRFSLRYMYGDRLYRRFFSLLTTLTLVALIMATANQLFLFLAAWTLTNLLLVLLMIHKKEWRAAKYSGWLAFSTLAAGSFCLALAFTIMYSSAATATIDALTQQSYRPHNFAFSFSIALIIIAALIQSALFPFQRWLLSSLNSPTPVSAFMHAGIINGGGILLVKFAPLILLQPALLTLLFVLGALSALLGTLWKLMQHDIKKMLACSTMAQMGFMMMQCSLGLFAAAITHLCWHGLFKAYLFLNSGSALQQKRLEPGFAKVSLKLLLVALIGGVVAVAAFAYITNKPFSFSAASSFILFFAFIAGAQVMLTWIYSYRTIQGGAAGLLLAAFSGAVYGISIRLIESLIPQITQLTPISLTPLHWLIMALFAVFWIVFTLDIPEKLSHSRLGCRIYINLFNASQPAAKTVTALRSDYFY